VHDTTFVRVGERTSDVAENAHDVAQRERTIREPRAQGFAVDERHRVVRHAVDLAGGQYGHDMRMLKVRREQRLALEPIQIHAGAVLDRNDLDHDAPAKCRFRRREHARHAAATELALDRVRRAQGRL
jgi:hypothetical protein